MTSHFSDSQNSIGRRNFIKSLFGLGGAIEPPRKTRTPRPVVTFVWCDLRTGQIGFPTGLRVEVGLPGSTMKLVAVAAAMEEGIINPNETIDCPGHLKIGQREFSCVQPHGSVDVVHALAHSCNVYFATLSQRMSASLFLEYARRLGLDKGVGTVSAGKFPEAANEPTSEYVLGMSKNLQPNVLQLMRLSALVATRGDIPYLHSAEDKAEGKPRFHVKLGDGTWSRLREGMQLAVHDGTAHKLDPDNAMHLAAKTGTAPYGKKFQSCITGYFPTEAPRYAFCLAASTGTSQETAVPKAREFLFAATWP
ncbi:MAG TPA: penicillin-binding transpeptidase domain-containing protein [Candidatus Obscuribacterales bacterium]